MDGSRPGALAGNQSLTEFLRDPTVTVACVVLIAVSLAWIVVSRLIARNLARAHATGATRGAARSLRLTRRGRLTVLAAIAALLGLGAWAALATFVTVDRVGERDVRSAAPARPRKEHAHERRAKLVTEGVTVQVLNGTASMTAEQHMQSRLAELGFRVTAVNPSAGEYERTTVFWSFPEARKTARALAARFGWLSAPKPATLSPSVSIHVVVGRDEI